MVFVTADLTPMENSISRIERSLQVVTSEQRRMRIREQVHRDSMPTSSYTKCHVIYTLL